MAASDVGRSERFHSESENNELWLQLAGKSTEPMGQAPHDEQGIAP